MSLQGLTNVKLTMKEKEYLVNLDKNKDIGIYCIACYIKND